MQKEREAEGDQYADKEKFVTTAYRKKMEEMQKQEEEEGFALFQVVLPHLLLGIALTKGYFDEGGLI